MDIVLHVKYVGSCSWTSEASRGCELAFVDWHHKLVKLLLLLLGIVLFCCWSAWLPAATMPSCFLTEYFHPPATAAVCVLGTRMTWLLPAADSAAAAPPPAAPKGELDFLADGMNNAAQQQQDGFGEAPAFGADGMQQQQPGMQNYRFHVYTYCFLVAEKR
jgi:hypothetical protein